MTTPSRLFRRRLAALLALPAAAAAFAPAAVRAFPTVASTREDFRLPGTQPLSVSAPFAPPSTCAPCHGGYGSPDVEPLRNWQGSMMAQSGRDPLMFAALAIANQDADHSGETCLRCHFPKGWLEGRSTPEDGSAMTADDRHGVQCSVCHRLVDPFAAPENPAEDTAILAALAAPVPALGSAMMVAEPLDRLRGPFDVVADLGFDPHAPTRSTLISPFHTESDLCGVCHNLRNPAFTRNLAGEFELNPLDTPADPTLGFPEQSTYDEWVASEYATTGVFAPQFGRNRDTVSSCQHCHMPAVTGKAANLGVVRDDLPLHEMAGGNTFVPQILPDHPLFGAEVDAALLQETVANATSMLRRAATVSATLAAGTLTVRVTNESGHKLPTGYPDGRRMWLHVRAFDAARNVVFESGRYVFSTGELAGYGRVPSDPDYDPNLHVWETLQGMSPALATMLGLTPGPSFHLVLNNVREKDNRIPPRGFANAAYAAFDGQPVGATYVDGQYWDDVAYPVGSSATDAEATLYYQTTSREYVEFLRDENLTTAAGNILHDLWEQHDRAAPVAMARAFVTSDAETVNRCHLAIAQAEARFRRKYAKEWAKCFAKEAVGLSCDAAARDARLAAAEAKLRAKVGGLHDRKCTALSFSPSTLGHGSVCPVPCPTVELFAMSDVASCAVCMAGALGDEALAAAYGVAPPSLPQTQLSGAPASCQRALDKAAVGLAGGWADALAECEQTNLSGPPVDCSTDPSGAIATARQKAAQRVAGCSDFSGLAGCATGGTVAAAQACLEAAIGPAAVRYTGVAYP